MILDDIYYLINEVQIYGKTINIPTPPLVNNALVHGVRSTQSIGNKIQHAMTGKLSLTRPYGYKRKDITGNKLANDIMQIGIDRVLPQNQTVNIGKKIINKQYKSAASDGLLNAIGL